MAERRDGGWSAICIDLDIAADGESFAEARDRLHTAIVVYLERVAELPEDEQIQFLNRRAPLSVRAEFVLFSWLARLIHKCSDRHRSFTVPKHAHA